jgi:perosamine synthetase
MNPAAVEARINERTRAIIALHAFGAPCQADVLAELARRYGVHLVEDCAHSLGAQLGGQQTGCFGTAGFFSFETTKPLNTWGGGMLVTRDARLAARARELSEGATASRRGVVEKMLSVRAERWLMSTGLSAPLLYLLASPRTADRTNAFYRNFQHAPASHGRYLPLQATFGLQRLAALEQRRAARERSVALYRRHLDPRVHIQRLTDGSSSTWYFLVVQLPVPSAPVRLRLLRRGIDAGVGHEIADDCAALLGFHDCPEVTRVQRFALNLPLWDDMPERSIRRVARTLNRLL